MGSCGCKCYKPFSLETRTDFAGTNTNIWGLRIISFNVLAGLWKRDEESLSIAPVARGCLAILQRRVLEWVKNGSTL